MGKFINAVDASRKAKKILCITEEDIIRAFEEINFNELITEAADKGYFSTRIKFKYPAPGVDTNKYFSAIKEYATKLGYIISYDHTNKEPDGNKYNFYNIYWEE